MPDKIDWRHKPEKARLAAYDIRRTALSNAWKKRFAHDDFSPEERQLGGLPHKLPKGDAPAPSPQDEELGITAAWDEIKATAWKNYPKFKLRIKEKIEAKLKRGCLEM